MANERTYKLKRTFGLATREITSSSGVPIQALLTHVSTLQDFYLTDYVEDLIELVD